MALWGTSRWGAWTSAASHGGSSSRGGWSSDTEKWSQWECSCGCKNYSNYGKQAKNCRQCGLRKSYAQAVRGSTEASASPAQKSVTDNLKAVAAQLKEVLDYKAASDTTAPTGAQGAAAVDKKAISGEIRGLEASLAALPEGADFTLARE